MSSSPLIWVLHGPNLNKLGQREPEVYGHTTLPQIDQMLIDHGKKHGVQVATFQSNHEGQLIDHLHQAPAAGVKFIVFNPAAFTHTSVAIRDALSAIATPFIEVHLSNVHRREAFRHHSYFSDIAQAVICGLGPAGYLAALDFAIQTTGAPRA
jgi:3-dehydroquinate dehydratase II